MPGTTQRFGNNDLKTARLSVTSAQLLVIFTTPLTILAAPGLNKALVIDELLIQVVPGSVAYTGGGAINFVYHGGSIAPLAATMPAATLTANTASYNLIPQSSALVQVPANTGLDITNATAVFAAGNGTLTITIWYRHQVLGLTQ
jgi:hypothetical protein